MSPRLLAFVYFIGVELLCLLLLPGDWRGLAVIPILGYWAAWVILGAGHGAHADRARLQLKSPAAGSHDMAHDLEWDEEKERRRAHGLTEAIAPWDEPNVAYSGGWESGACADDGKVERWPGHEDPWGLPPLPETSTRGAGLVLLPTVDSDGAGTDGPAPSPPGPGAAPAHGAAPDPPTTLAGWDAAEHMRRQDADVAAYLDRQAAGLADHARWCVAKVKGKR